MKRVELLGSAGSGKSSLYRALVGQPRRARSFLSDQEARRERLRGEKGEGAARRALLRLPKAWRLLERSASNRPALAALSQDGARWAGVIQAGLRAILDSEASVAKKAARTRWLFQAVQDISFLDPLGEAVLFDEGLIQKGCGIFIDLPFDALAVSFFRAAEPPDGLILVEAPVPTIVARKLARETGVPDDNARARQTRRVERDLATMRRVKDMMEARGAATLVVGGSLPFADNVARVNAFVAGLQLPSSNA